MYGYEDEMDFYEVDHVASPSEAMQEFAFNVGGYDRYKNSAWILTDYDVWVPNPHYRGKPQSHPECHDEEYDQNYDDNEAVKEKEAVLVDRDDDIPF